jgi:hypothetical protein
VLHDPTPALLARFAEAAEQGIPYQSLISGLIHQFVEGQLATRTDRLQGAAAAPQKPLAEASGMTPATTIRPVAQMPRA